MKEKIMLKNAVQTLHAYYIPDTISEAGVYLSKQLETVTLLVVFFRYFPSRFPEIWMKDQRKLIPAPGKAYSAAEIRCLKLMESALFPFSFEYLLMCAADKERLAFIPLHSFCIDHCTYGFEPYSLGWQLLGVLNRNLDIRNIHIQDVSRQLDPDVVLALQDAKVYSRTSWSWSRFEAVCITSEQPLCYLPQAIKMLDHSTENIFLDPTAETAVQDMGWDLEDIDYLIEEWKHATVILEQANALVEWVEADQSRFRKVVQVWNHALS